MVQYYAYCECYAPFRQSFLTSGSAPSALPVPTYCAMHHSMLQMRDIYHHLP